MLDLVLDDLKRYRKISTMAFVGSSSLVVVRGSNVKACSARMSGAEEGSSAASKSSRREFMISAAAVLAAMGGAEVAKADRDYAGLPYLGGSETIDINNANIRVYQKLPGMYPNIAKLMVKNAPFDSVQDVYKIPELNEKQKEVLKKYEKNFIALPPAPEYVVDQINNGLYR